MLNHGIEQKIFDDLFKNHAVDIKAFLRASKVKGSNYDKFRDVGYEKNIQNPIFIKAMQRAITPNSLIIREIGLAETGAMQIIVKQDDIAVIKLAERIQIDEEEYTPWLKMLGNRLQITKMPFNYSKVIIFRLNK